MKLLIAPLTVIGALLLVALALPGAVNADDTPTDNPLAGTNWSLELNHGAPMLRNTAITLSFDGNGQAGGSGGCNSYGGSYTIDGKRLQFSDVFSTLMACLSDEVMQQEVDYLAALSMVTGYRRIGPERLVLDLRDGGALVFVAIPTLPGSAWVLIDDGLLDGENLVTADSGVTLMFNKDGTVNGDSGCNLYRSTYTLIVGSLTFDPILSTRRACLNEDANALEAHLFAALEATTRYTLTPDQLSLDFGEDGQQLVFRRILNLEGTTWQLVAFGAEDDPTPMGDKVITVSFDKDNRASASGWCQPSVGDAYPLEVVEPTAIHELPSVLLLCLGESPATMMVPVTLRYGINDDNGQLVMHYATQQVLVFEWIFQPSEE